MSNMWISPLSGGAERAYGAAQARIEEVRDARQHLSLHRRAPPGAGMRQPHARSARARGLRANRLCRAGTLQHGHLLHRGRRDRPAPPHERRRIRPLQLARQWISRLAAAIRAHDRQHLIGLGLLPDTTGPFAPANIADLLDVLLVHEYPVEGRADEGTRPSGFEPETFGSVDRRSI